MTAIVISLDDYRKAQQIEAVAAEVACVKLMEAWPPSRPAMARACRKFAAEWIERYGFPPRRPVSLSPQSLEVN